MNSRITHKNVIGSNFFLENAVSPHLWDEGWEYIRKEGIILHDSVNTVPYREFPPVLERFAFGQVTAIAPKREWNSVLIPFSPLNHDDKYFKGQLISDILASLMDKLDSGKKFIASAESWYLFFAEIKKFKYETIYNIAGTNEMTSFFLFDESLRYCFGFDFDFEYSFFSSADLKQDDERLKGTFAEWDEFFVDNFVRIAPKNTTHLRLFETVLRPSIPRKFIIP